MKIAFVSNWRQVGCGVSNWGDDFAAALETAGHQVIYCGWHHQPSCDVRLYNWDSGTLPKDQPITPGSTVFVHHWYRGQPEALDTAALVLTPMKDQATGLNRHYFPYPVPATRCTQLLKPGTIGTTTIRGEGVDYLQAAAARRGLVVCPPDRWRPTSQEVARLAGYEFLALWYADSPGRSLALATALAAQRPLLLSTGSQMFEYAYTYSGAEEIYWAPYTREPEELVLSFDRIRADLKAGLALIPRQLAGWSWPVAIKVLEDLWRR